MSRSYKAKFLAVPVVGLSLATVAAAQNTDYPGTLCHEYNSTTQHIVYSSLGPALNSAASANGFICPALQQGGRVLSAQVCVNDSSASDSVSCRVQSKNTSGITGWWSASVKSGDSGVNDNKCLQLGALAGFNDPGVKFIQCTVPAVANGLHSGVNSYSITED